MYLGHLPSDFDDVAGATTTWDIDRAHLVD